MGSVKKVLILRPVAQRILAQRATVFLLLILLLPPTWPFVKGNLDRVERAESSVTGEAAELFKIYSLIRNARRDPDDGWIWQIAKTVMDESRRHTMDPLLVLAVIGVESDFDGTAVSIKGAKGLMQLLPIAAQASAEERRSLLGDKDIPETPPLDNPVLNIKLGISYLDSLKKSFGDTRLALAAYNHGPTWIRSRIADEQRVPLGYTTRVLSTYQRYREDLPETN